MFRNNNHMILQRYRSPHTNPIAFLVKRRSVLETIYCNKLLDLGHLIKNYLRGENHHAVDSTPPWETRRKPIFSPNGVTNFLTKFSHWYGVTRHNGHFYQQQKKHMVKTYRKPKYHHLTTIICRTEMNRSPFSVYRFKVNSSSSLMVWLGTSSCERHSPKSH